MFSYVVLKCFFQKNMFEKRSCSLSEKKGTSFVSVKKNIFEKTKFFKRTCLKNTLVL